MPGYFSYLLRLWQAGLPETPVWRASLENPHTHQLIGFNSLEELCTFLQTKDFTQLAALPDSADHKEPDSSFLEIKEHKHGIQ